LEANNLCLQEDHPSVFLGSHDDEIYMEILDVELIPVEVGFGYL